MNAEWKIRREARGRLVQAGWDGAVAVALLSAVVPLLILLSGSVVQLFFRSAGLVQISPSGDQLVWQQGDASLYWYLFAAGGISLLINWLLGAPLRLGMKRWSLAVARGESPSVAEMFYFFSSIQLYVRSLNYSVRLFVRIVLFGFLSLAPGAVLLVLADVRQQAGEPYAWITLVGTAVFLAGLGLFVALCLRYFLAGYLAAGDGVSVSRCFSESCRRMAGFRRRVFALFVSFLGWYLLCFFILPFLYVSPYAGVSMATCAKWRLMEEGGEVAPKPPPEADKYMD